MVGVDMSKRKIQVSLLTSLLFVLLVLCSVGWASTSVPPLLLSLDVEKPGDVQALATINLQDPATYFVTGQFALDHPGLVGELSQKGTIGSHSHTHQRLTEMDADGIRQDLLSSIKALESATGEAPIWFRSPFLEINDEILTIAADLGFRYDSSEAERWVKQGLLEEFPISMNTTSRILFSDYDIFISYSLDDQMTLELLKQNYLDRFGTGRPFVFLLHPSIIAEKADLLHRFIDFVKSEGGELLSFDAYLERFQPSPDPMIGISLGHGVMELDRDRVVMDLKNIGVTDVFVETRNGSRSPVGGDNGDFEHLQPMVPLLERLQGESIRVHARLPVLDDPAAATSVPERAMADGNGASSAVWLSPSHPSLRERLQRQTRQLLDMLPLSGIHLDSLAYPGLSFDFSAAALETFEKDTGITVPKENAAMAIPEQYYNEWVGWRGEQITGLAEAVAEVVAEADREIVLSASLSTEALMDYRHMESSGQDYRQLAGYLDLIVSTSTVNTWMDQSYSTTRIATVAKAMIGSRPLALSITDFADDNVAEAELSSLIEHLSRARIGTHGLMLPPYRALADNELLGSNDFKMLRHVLDVPDNGLAGMAGEKQAPSPAFSPKVESVAETLPTERDSQSGSATAMGTTAAAPEQMKKSTSRLLIMAAGMILLIVGTFYWVRMRGRGRSEELDQGKTEIIDWLQLDMLIGDGNLSGELVHSVARHLKAYDPVNTSRYRVALVLYLVANKPQTIDELVKTDIAVPGWQVLAMSHLKEALVYGFINISDEHIKITAKGLNELETMQAMGFEHERWIFTEKRLHEVLLVTCPHCGGENSSHWYWTKFPCARCGEDIVLRQCTNITKSSADGIELSQHQYA